MTDEESKIVVAHNINRILARIDRSRYWLAKETGEWESRIASVCNAKVCCGAGMLSRIAKALDVSVDELFSPIRKKHSKAS